MNLNAVDNLLYKRKNVLAYLLSPDVQIFAGGWGGEGEGGRGEYWEDRTGIYNLSYS